MAIKQSATYYVKKGTVVNGKKVTKGYTARKDNDKKVKGKVEITEGGNTRGRLKGKAVGSIVNAQRSTGGAGKKGGGGKGGGGGNGSNGVTPLTPAQKKAKKVAKVAKRVANTTVAARKADTVRRNTGTAKTTKMPAPPKDIKVSSVGTEGPKGSDRARNAAILGKAPKRVNQGAASWGSKSRPGNNNPFAALSVFAPGKKAPKMPKFKPSSTKYNWSS